MNVLKHSEQPLEKWRDGVMTRMRVSALTESHSLLIFEQFCKPGLGAPAHVHAVEEVLEVVDGTAKVFQAEESVIVESEQSVVIPAGVYHGFRNAGQGVLHVRATMAAPIFEASYQDPTETSRRYVP